MCIQSVGQPAFLRAARAENVLFKYNIKEKDCQQKTEKESKIPSSSAGRKERKKPNRITETIRSDTAFVRFGNA